MIEFRQQIKELVTYILNPEERDEDVIENYTDTVMLACEEYHIKQLKLYGVRITLPDQKEIIALGMKHAKEGKLLNNKASIKDYLFGFIDGARYIKEKVEAKGN